MTIACTGGPRCCCNFDFKFSFTDGARNVIADWLCRGIKNLKNSCWHGKVFDFYDNNAPLWSKSDQDFNCLPEEKLVSVCPLAVPDADRVKSENLYCAHDHGLSGHRGLKATVDQIKRL